MSLCKAEQLARMLALCRGLDADVRYSSADGHINVQVWEGWGDPVRAELARAIQKTLLQQSAQYPNIVCYCFDDFSTLIYAI
ncbi:MAG: hypothetical protein IJV64_00325 [Oscillospiraceae bacterium]|nr:hypothetical protein [Oscillospiraceae bacterium]